jgi:hypothetical protein
MSHAKDAAGMARPGLTVDYPIELCYHVDGDCVDNAVDLVKKSFS